MALVICQKENMSKYVRTVLINENGLIQSARLNIETGEIKPFVYKNAKEERLKQDIEITGSINDDPDNLVVWQLIKPPSFVKVDCLS